MPKSGKTTTMDIVSHYLKRCGMAVKEFHGGGRYAPMDKSHLGALNLYLGCQAIEQVLELRTTSNGIPVAILDRALTDRLIFSRALCDLGRLSAQHLSAWQELLNVPELRHSIDMTFVFTCTPQLSLQRENKDKLSTASGRIMNTDLLEALRTGALSITSGESPPCSKQLFHVDTEKFDGSPQATARLVVEHLRGIDALKDVPGPDSEGLR